MTSKHILSRAELSLLTNVQKVAIGVTGSILLSWWFGLVPLTTVVVVVSIVSTVAAFRWRGEWLGELFVRAVRFHTRSRFSSVEHEIVGDNVQVTCRGQRTFSLWRPHYRGRLDLRDEERAEWRRVLQRVEESTQRGETAHFSFHVHGHDSWLATSTITLSNSWIIDSSRFHSEMPRWMYESWTEVQTDSAFYRVFDVHGFGNSSDSVIDTLSDPRERWSTHAHFLASPQRDAIRRSRRDRHAADTAMTWRGLRGVVSPATLTDLRATRQHHEEHVARGAALLDFRMCVVVRASSMTELNEFSAALRDVAARAGVALRHAVGEQAQGLVASWPGPSPW